MTEAEQLALAELREEIYERDGGRCQTCGKMLAWGGFELAHRIPQNKTMLRVHGADVIHHPDNLALSCRNDACNSGLSISNRPMEMWRLALAIRRKIDAEEDMTK